MKNNFLRVSFLTALVATAALAQSSLELKATIPFGFAVGNQTLPAGEYTVTGASAASPALIIKSADQHAGGIAITNGVQANSEERTAKLVFHRYGDRYFLAQVWPGTGSVGRQLPQSVHERELSASVRVHPATVLASRFR
ncbi:MAG: hypothetical protein C5B51_02245 [Terriglobia bacterium]|nr:MAG: hypothetical protein C5B51_02245 [Terriglobia bacterium]